MEKSIQSSKTFSITDVPEKDEEENLQPEFSFKLCITGSKGVGKTSFILYEKTNEFSQKTLDKPFGHFTKKYNINNKIINLHIWDIDNDEKKENLTSSFFKSALCIIVMFSLDSMKSFNFVDWYLNEIEKNEEGGERLLIILVGNKKDMKREVSEEEVDKLRKRRGMEFYYETSAVNGDMIHEVFKEVMKQLYMIHVEPILECNDRLNRSVTYTSGGNEEKGIKDILDKNYNNCCNCKNCCFCQ